MKAAGKAKGAPAASPTPPNIMDALSMSPFQLLDRNVLSHLLSLLGLTELTSLSKVCRFFALMTKEDSFWKEMYRRRADREEEEEETFIYKEDSRPWLQRYRTLHLQTIYAAKRMGNVLEDIEAPFSYDISTITSACLDWVDTLDSTKAMEEWRILLGSNLDESSKSMVLARIGDRMSAQGKYRQARKYYYTAIQMKPSMQVQESIQSGLQSIDPLVLKNMQFTNIAETAKDYYNVTVTPLSEQTFQDHMRQRDDLVTQLKTLDESDCAAPLIFKTLGYSHCMCSLGIAQDALKELLDLSPLQCYHKGRLAWDELCKAFRADFKSHELAKMRARERDLSLFLNAQKQQALQVIQYWVIFSAAGTILCTLYLLSQPELVLRKLKAKVLANPLVQSILQMYDIVEQFLMDKFEILHTHS